MEEVSLRRLSPAGTAALIGAYLGFEAVSPELCDLVHARTLLTNVPEPAQLVVETDR